MMNNFQSSICDKLCLQENSLMFAFRKILRVNQSVFIVTGLFVTDISYELNSEYILWCHQKTVSYGKLRWNHLNIMMGFPFGLVYSDASFCSGECFWWEVTCATVRVCLLVSSVAWWDEEIDESFVGLLTSPLHSNLSSCGFTMSFSTPPAHHKRGEHRLTLVYWKSKRLNSILCLAPLPLWSFPSSV